MSFAKIFLYLDIFGVDFVFLTNGQEKHRTVSGVVLTILYSLIVVLLFMQFGVDLYERKNPKVSTNLEMVPYAPVKLSNSNFTFGYRIEDSGGNIFLDETVALPKLFIFYLEVVNGSWVEKSAIKPKNRRCHDFPDYKEKEAYFGISLASWYCIDFDNFTWGGNWDGNFVSLFEVNIEQCMNSTENNNHCATPERMEKTFIHERSSGNLFYSQLFLSSQPAMDNYEQPLKTNLVNSYSLLNMQLSKRRVQTFKTTALSQDIGWFWKDLRYQEVIELDTSEADFTFKDKWDQGVVFSTYNYLGGKRQVYSRTYTKIQEVIANIGGFAKFAYTIIAFVFWYIKSTYRSLFFMNNFEKYKSPIKFPFNITNDNKISATQKFSFNDYMCVKFCKSKSDAKLKRNHKIYLRLQACFNDKMDITSYFKLFHQLTFLSKAPMLAEYVNETGKNLKTLYSEANSPQKNTLHYPKIMSLKPSYATMDDFK